MTRAFLLAWNPRKWAWADLSGAIDQVGIAGVFFETWSVGNRGDLPVGSRVFLMRLGEDPKGLVGSGWSTYLPRRVPHWDATRAAAGDTTLSIGVEFDVLNEHPVIDLAELARAPFDALSTWTPQSSGVELNADLAAHLEAEWATRTALSGSGAALSQTPSAGMFREGALRVITVNSYERDARARRACVAHYGATCHVCGFSFGKAYGAALEGFIHVHHLRPLAEIGQTYVVNAIEDLRPVCPNCHAALHHRRVPYSIQELKEMVSGNSASAEQGVAADGLVGR